MLEEGPRPKTLFITVRQRIPVCLQLFVVKDFVFFFFFNIFEISGFHLRPRNPRAY